MTPQCYAKGCSKPSVHALEANSVLLVPSFRRVEGRVEPNGATVEAMSWTVRLCPEHYREVAEDLVARKTAFVATELHGKSIERRRSEERRAS